MGIISFFSNIFGYALNFIYEIIQNYGVSIIVFSIILKIILLPISIKQQTTMKKTSKIQGKLKEIQKKYKDNPEKMNQETMALYKSENMSPFSGCLSSIVQIILLLSIFYLVRSPLTYMKKIDTTVIDNYKNEIVQESEGTNLATAYPEISIIKYVNDKEEKNSDFYINMNFLGLDLSNIPKENWQDYTVYIIPILYVISTVISMRITTNMNYKKKEEPAIIEGNGGKEKEEPDMTQAMNKNMSLFMPIMSVTISLIAPLGMALYWLVNNILMTAERLVIDKVLDSKEAKKDAE